MLAKVYNNMKRFIVVIDHDFDTRGTLNTWLNGMGFDAVAARNGDHGLALMSAFASIGCPIDGILLNFEIPRADGLAVLQKIQEHFDQVPVIIMATTSDPTRLEEALRQGGRDVLMKPFDRFQLQEKCVRHFIPSWI